SVEVVVRQERRGGGVPGKGLCASATRLCRTDRHARAATRCRAGTGRFQNTEGETQRTEQASPCLLRNVAAAACCISAGDWRHGGDSRRDAACDGVCGD